MTLPAQPRVTRFLRRALSSERLPHALLFVGPPGAGQEEVARAVASALLCEGTPPYPEGCGACSACRRVAHGNHPDLHLVLTEAEGVTRGVAEAESGRRPSMQIRIDQVRELARQMRLRPYEGRARVAIVVDAHRMNDNAANALLKTLEEPGPASTLLLIAPHERALLPTIASRCSRLRFSPLPSGPAPDDLEADANARELLTTLLGPRTDERLDAIEALGRDRQDAERLLGAIERVLTARLREAAATGSSPVRPLLRALDALDELREGLEVNAHVQIALEEVFLLRAE